MKKLTIVCCLLVGTYAFAQKVATSKVPAAVISTFNKSYPGIKDAKWEKEKANYEANFRQDNKKMAALYDANGALMETETGIEVSTLPAGAKEYLTKNCKGDKVKEAARLVMANGDINYEAEVKGMDLIFDAKGTFIKKVKD